LSKYEKNDVSLYSLGRDWANATPSLAINGVSHSKSKLNETQEDSEEFVGDDGSGIYQVGIGGNYVTQLPEPDRSVAFINEQDEIKRLNETIGARIRSTESEDMDLIG
jgi:hypothetical protein